jgi:starvation-inducible DNA-binding protein
VFYLKARHYHWNVKGRNFFGLHAKFETFYTDWAVVIDDLAERVRALGGRPIHTLATVLQHATLDEDPSIPDADEMVRRLSADLERMHGAISEERDQAAEQYDQGTADLMADIQDHIENDLWVLEARLRDA